MSLPAASDKDAGFTLIEFCVAILILTIGILALLQTVNMAMSQDYTKRRRDNAMVIADQAMATERGNLFSTITTNVTPVKQINFGLGFVNYSVKETVVKLPPSPAVTDAKTITFTVSWKDKTGRHDHSLSTMLTDPSKH